MPLPWIVGTGVAVLIAAVLVWTLAHNAGARSERQRLVVEATQPVADPLSGTQIADSRGSDAASTLPTSRTESGNQRPSQNRPTNPTPNQANQSGGSTGGDDQGSRAAQQNPRQPPNQPTQPTPTPVQPDPLPDGSIGSNLPWTFGIDPRQPGSNYLLVVRLPGEAAFHAAGYLTANGVPAAALPVRADLDPVLALENNADHLVVVLEGIPPGQFSQRAQWRDALQNRVAEIGRRYKAANVLYDDLARSKHQWARFDG